MISDMVFCLDERISFISSSSAGVIHSFIEKMPIKDSQDFRKFADDNRPGLDLKQTVITPSGDEIQATVGFGVDFFRPFYGV